MNFNVQPFKNCSGRKTSVKRNVLLIQELFKERRFERIPEEYNKKLFGTLSNELTEKNLERRFELSLKKTQSF